MDDFVPYNEGVTIPGRVAESNIPALASVRPGEEDQTVTGRVHPRLDELDAEMARISKNPKMAAQLAILQKEKEYRNNPDFVPYQEETPDFVPFQAEAPSPDFIPYQAEGGDPASAVAPKGTVMEELHRFQDKGAGLINQSMQAIKDSPSKALGGAVYGLTAGMLPMAAGIARTAAGALSLEDPQKTLKAAQDWSHTTDEGIRSGITKVDEFLGGKKGEMNDLLTDKSFQNVLAPLNLPIEGAKTIGRIMSDNPNVGEAVGENVAQIGFGGLMAKGIKSSMPKGGDRFPVPKFNEADLTQLIADIEKHVDDTTIQRDKWDMKDENGVQLTPAEAFEKNLSLTEQESLAQEASLSNINTTPVQHTVSRGIDILADTNLLDNRPELKNLAQAYQRLITKLGLDNIPVDRLENDAGDLGTYWPKQDIVGMKQGRHDAPQTFLHETTHAIIYGMQRLVERAKEGDIEGARWVQKFPEVAQKIRDIEAVYEMAKKEHELRNGSLADRADAIRKKLEEEKTTGIPAIWSDEERSFKNDHYGFKDSAEFVAEALTNPKFQEKLRELRVPHEFNLGTPKNKNPILNFWNVTRKALANALSGPIKDTVYDKAVEHIFDIIDQSTAEHRKTNVSVLEANRVRLEDRQTRIENTKNKLASLTGIQKYTTQQISYLLKESASFEEFKTRLANETGIQGPTWDGFVERNAQRLWENSHQYVDAVGRDQGNVNVSKGIQAWLQETGSVEDFMGRQGVLASGESPQASLPSHMDVSSLGNNILTSQVRAVHAGMSGTFGNMVVKYVHDRGNQIKNMASILYHKAIENFGPYTKLTRNEQLDFMARAAAIDSRGWRQKLTDEGLQWPTAEMLKNDLGMSDKQVLAYQSVTKGLDFLHNLLDQVQMKTKGEHLPRIPGYMPHVFKGAYKVFVKVTEHQRNGPDREWTQAVRGFSSRGAAMDFVKELNAGTHDTPALRQERRAVWNEDTAQPFWVQKFEDMQNSMAATFNEHLRNYKQELAMDEGTKTMLDKIENKNAMGFSKHLMDRSDVQGYLGEFGKVYAKQPYNPFSHYEAFKTNNQILKLYQNYAKNVTEHYKNVIYIDEVASRILSEMPENKTGKMYYGKMFEKLHNLQKHLWEYSYNFTGENLNHLAFVDNAMQKVLLSLGRDPTLYRNFTRDLRNFFSQVTLRVHPINYLANLSQSSLVMGMLDTAGAHFRKAGLETMSSAEAYVRAASDHIVHDPEVRGAIRWAEEQHILDAQLDMELKTGKFGKFGEGVHTATAGKVNPAIERFGREHAFIAAFEYFRHIYPEDLAKARMAAANIMEMTHVNYDRSSRPLMYQNFGVLGEAISPFAVFRNAWLGNLSIMIRQLAENPKDIQMYKGFMMTQATFFMLAGAAGMIGVQEADWLIKTFNNLFSQSLPSVEEMLWKVEAPDVVAFGALSAFTKAIPYLDNGVYAGGSMGALGVDDAFSAPLGKFIMGLANLSVDGIKQALYYTGLGKGATNEEVYKDLRAAAPSAPVAKMLPEIMYKAEGQRQTAWKSSSNEALYDREDADVRAMMLTGKPSLSERKKQLEEQYGARNAKDLNTQIKNYVSIAADRIDNKGAGMSYEEAMNNAVRLGKTEDEFQKMVTQEVERRRVPLNEREAKKDTIGTRQKQFWRGIVD